MADIERFSGATEGQPGGIVDEAFSEEIDASYLYYACYDKEGNVLACEDFDRDASPEFISETLNSQADDILRYPPDGMNLDEVLNIVGELRKYASEVPGL